MSWYSKIYVYVREFRLKNPFRGYLLHLCLNLMLCSQMGGLVYGVFVYMYIFLPVFVADIVQKTVYFVVFVSLVFMYLVSLLVTIFTPIARVPEEYRADAAFDAALKKVTPLVGERYFPDQSSEEQVKAQNDLLNEFAASRELEFMELDSNGRLRYCYQCSLIKPDRAHHCSSCGFCVVKFDHHCPWINKCVNARNYKAFLLYLIYGELLIIFTLLTEVQALIVFFCCVDKKAVLLRFVLLVINIAMHCVFSYYPLGELLKYHVKLLADNETTCEQAKTPMIRGDNRANYDHGWYLNYRAVFGWGLWGFPIPTPVTDGMHFHVKYSEDHVGDRYEVVPRGLEAVSRTMVSVKTAKTETTEVDEKEPEDANNNNTTNTTATTNAATTPKNEDAR